MFKRLFLMFALFFALSIPTYTVFADGDGHGEPTGDHDEEAASGSFSLPLLLSIGAGVLAAGGAATTKRFNPFQLGVIGLGVMTGVLHLIIGLGGETLLLLNGLGYLALLGVIFFPLGELDKYNQLLRIVLLGYTVVTLVAYFALHTPAQYSATGIITKIIEVALLVVLGLRIWQYQAEARLVYSARS